MSTALPAPTSKKRVEAEHPTGGAVSINARSAPVIFCAAVGIISLGIAAQGWIRWILSDQFRPIETGSTPIPKHELYSLYAVQVVGVLLAVGLVVQFVIRPWRRDRTVPDDGLLIGACLLAWFWDPVFNFTQNWLTYNAHLLNLGTWSDFIPGWISPHQDRFGEPLLTGVGYIFWVFGSMLVLGAVLRKVTVRFPAITMPTLLAVGLVSCMLFDLAAELGGVLTGWYATPGGSHLISLFPNSRYRLPLSEVVCGGAQTMAWVSLRFFRNERGLTLAERGVDSLGLSAGRRLVVRFLALCGALALCALVYNVPIQLQGMHSDRWAPNVPSYLTGTCPDYGTTLTACGGPGVAIPRALGAP